MFFNGQFLYHKRTSKGDKYKFLSAAAVAEAFRNAPFDTGHLPRGVFRAGQTARGDFAAMCVPAACHDLTIEDGKAGDKQYKLRLPALVFFGIGGSYRVWAVKDDAPGPDAVIFHAPLPNVFEHGGVCWGQNTPPRASAATITEAWRLFIASPFNGHAASGKVRGVDGDVRPYLRRLARSGAKFPHADLKPAGTYSRLTLGDKLDSLIAGGGE